MVNSPQCRSVVRNNYWYSKNHLWSHFERRRRGKRSVVARSVDGKKKIAINFNSEAVRWVCPDGGSSALHNRTGDEVKRGRRKIFNRGFRFHLTEPELRSHIRCKFSHQVRFFFNHVSGLFSSEFECEWCHCGWAKFIKLVEFFSTFKLNSKCN